MSTIRGFLHRLRVLVDPESYAREVEREIRFHLELESMQQRGVGLNEVRAELAARRQFGNVTHVREEVRRMSGIEWLDRIRQNFGYAARGLRRSPGFTTGVVITLALGLGVNAAMFTFLDQVFVKAPAGVVNPHEVRLVYAGLVRADQPNGRMYVPYLWYPQIRELRHAVDSGSSMGLFVNQNDSVAVIVGAASHSARQAIANSDYFRVLGVRPQLGRLFDSEEDRIETAAPVAVISHQMWKRVFGGDPRVVGSTFRIKYRPITVIGVGPEGFAGTGLDRSDFWMPIGNEGSGFVNKAPWYDSYQGEFSIVTRFTSAAAEQRFFATASRVAPPVKIAFFGDSTGEVLPGPIQAALGPATPGKEVSISIRLAGVALIVLLITLANVSNLLLVRATRREREIAIRRALGVSRARLFEQLLTESVLLAVIGGAVALLFAIWVGSAMRGLLLPDIRWTSGVLDIRLAAFAGGVALLTGMAVGLVPAIHAWRPDLLSLLRGGKGTGGRRGARLRAGLLVTQAALSVVLLVGSGLFVRSLRNVLSIDLGFDVERTSVVRVIADTGSLTASMTEAMPVILERLAAIPGVESVAATSSGPMLGASYSDLFIPGRDSLPLVHGRPGAARKTLTPGYFRTVGQPIIQGRDFAKGDPPSVIVSEAMAKAYWPGRSPLGQCLIIQKMTNPCRPVVGVVGETHLYRIVNDAPVAYYYMNGPETPFVVVRLAPAMRARVAGVVAAEIKRLVPRAQIVQLRPMEILLEHEIRPWRLGATLFTAMGVLAILVAAIGVYSVVAYSVSQRAHEMGVRIAMGAQLRDISRLVVGEGLRTMMIGIAIGTVLALAAGKLVASLLYGVSPRDPGVLVTAAIVLGLMGIAASVIPALRAARVDPMTTLRVD